MEPLSPRRLDAGLLPAGFAFVNPGLDRSDALRADARALDRAWSAGRVLVLDADGRAAANADGAPLQPRGGELASAPGDAVLLGVAGDGQAWFAVASAAAGAPAPEQWIDLRRAADSWPATVAAAFAHARGMLHWQARARYCGACGAATGFRRGGYVAHCSGCGLDHYPRVDPAVIVAVGDGERLLLGRQPGWAPRRWSVLAGFVEPGETPEQTVVREVHEETGVRVTACRYLGSQPWPFPSALMLGFEAVAGADEPRVDGELEAARWFSREEIGAALQRDDHSPDGDLVASPISIARALITHWYTHGSPPLTQA